MTGSFHSVRIDDRDVAHLTITHSRKANVLGTAINDELINALKALASNPAIRAVVLTGAGDKAFVAGADLKEMSGLDPKRGEAFISKLAELCEAVRQFPAPVIARVNGWCIGGGLELAMSCDMRVSATHAKFTMPEVKMGIPSVIQAVLMSRIVGMGRTRRMMYTGHVIDAETALAWGLVDEVAELAQLDQAVDTLLDPILECGPAVIRAQKEILNDWDELPLSDAIRRSITHFGQAFTTGEPQAAMRAFFEKKSG